MRIIIIIPTYDEAHSIKTVIEEIEREVVAVASPHAWHVLVVDGNSPDGTASVVRELRSTRPWLSLLEEGRKQGLAVAYAAGMRLAIDRLRADVVVEFDGDGQHDPSALPRMLRAIEDGADCVVGSRYIAGGSVPPEWGVLPKALSRLGSMYCRLLLELPVRDVTSGLKMTRVANAAALLPLNAENLLTRHYAYKIQFLHDLATRGLRITEVPISFRYRAHGSSKSSWRDIFESLKVTGILRLRTVRSWSLPKVALVGATGFAIQAAVFEMLSLQTGLLAPSVAALFGGEAAIISNFLLNERWTFSQRTDATVRAHYRFIKFQAASAASVVLQWSMLFAAERLTSDPWTLRLVLVTAVALGAMLNYSLYVLWIWRWPK